MSAIQKCAVIGGGAMGRQIGLNAAIHGYETVVCEPFDAVRDSLMAWQEAYLSERIAKGRMSAQEVADIKRRFSVTGQLEAACRDADIVIEAIIEDKAAKLDILEKVGALVRPDTLIVTNSSYMVSSTFKEVVAHPERLANLHYFMPALVMKLVEVVKGAHTSEETVERLMQFVRAVGKTPVYVRREEDGFIVNNILKAIKEEAYRLVGTGVCTVQDLDTAVELGLNHPMGPFKIDDMNGLDLRHAILKRRYEETGVKSYGYEMIEALCAQGRYGKRTKHGFYDYE